MTTGIKVSKPGESIFSNDIRNLSFHHDYTMLKYHSNTTTTSTLNAGDTESSATVSHSLGYVPAFLVYYKRSDESVERLIPDIPYGVGFDLYPWAYATTTGITVGYSSADPYNQISILTTDYYNSSTGRGNVYTGNHPVSGTLNGAMYFPGVTLNKDQSIVSAGIDYRVYSKGSGTGDVLMRTTGIDEDNTGDFSGYPFGRDQTTASTSQSQSLGSTPFTFEVNVKSQVEEIIARAGWSSGNAMAFLVLDNGSPSDVYVGDGLGAGIDVSKLIITKTGSLTISFRVIIFKDKIA